MNWRGKTHIPNGAPAKNGSPTTLPAAIIEIESGFVMGARLAGAPKAGLRRLAVTGVDGGIVNPSPLLPNVSNLDMLGQAIETVSQSLGNGGGRTGLLLPDGAVRVNVLEFDTLPSKTREMESLLRWRIKDSLGFAPEDARLSYQEIYRVVGRIELLVVAVKADVLAQYEAVLEPVRGGPVLALPATLALLPLLSESESGAQLLTHVCSGWVTHALVEGARLRFWRTRQLAHPEAASETGEVVSEAARAVASARDRFGLEITKAWLCSRPLAGDELKVGLGNTLGLPVENLPVVVSLDSELGVEERPLFNMFAAPLAGLISNAGRAS
ncbi:MAG: hypothetical protein ACRD18_14860 [Terriglobia bacterium]